MTPPDMNSYVTPRKQDRRYKIGGDRPPALRFLVKAWTAYRTMTTHGIAFVAGGAVGGLIVAAYMVSGTVGILGICKFL